MDRLHQELAGLPGLEQLSSSQLRDLPWRAKERVLIALFQEQVSSAAVAQQLQIKSRDRRLERKADKLLDDVDRAVVRKKEESHRADFMQVAAAELARLGAPALISWQKLVFDKECCAQAFRLLLTRIKSSRRSGVSTDNSSLLAARFADGGSRQRRGSRRESNHSTQDDEERRGCENELDEDLEPRTRFPPLKPTQGPSRHLSVTRRKESNNAAHSTSDWNFDTTIEMPPDEDGAAVVDMCDSSEKIVDQTGSGISIERTLPSTKTSYFASKFKRNQLQAFQEENAALTTENVKLRGEIKQLEALNAVLQNDNSNSSVLDDHKSSSEFAQRRMRLVLAQNVQLQRQIAILQDAVHAHENAETNLLSALNHWHSVIDAGREEAKAAGADQDATGTPTEPDETSYRQPIKWMLAVPDKLIDELKRVEGQIRGAANAASSCFETKLRLSEISASFLRSDDNSLQLSEIYGREPSSLAHLRVERVNQLENALACVAAELEQLSIQVYQSFPFKTSTTDPIRSIAYELGRRVRELILEVGAFGVVIPSASVPRSRHSTIKGGSVTALDVIKVLSAASGVTRGPAGAKEREKQARVMLKQMHATYTATENEATTCRREAEYWRAAWQTQDGILQQLAKRVRHLGQKKVEWCQHYLLTPMVNLAEVFTSFQQAYDENTTRQNPYLPLLVEALNMEHPLLENALKQWEDYFRNVQSQMDELVADYEANRLVLASSSATGSQRFRSGTPISELVDSTLPSVSEQVPVF